MPVTYSIEGNDVFRDGVKIAAIKLDRTIGFVDDDARAFALPLTKFLAEQEVVSRCSRLRRCRLPPYLLACHWLFL